jgi:glycosyltransferase involved in cell wall biosynthesis
VLDDGLFVRTPARETRPRSATFNQFVEAVARTGAFARVRYLVPVRNLRIWEVEPDLDPVDEACLEIVPTTFFSGIADYLLRAAYIAARNWRPIDEAIASSDLLWLRLPASNALLALAAAQRHGVPHFGWVAGSAREVAAAHSYPPPISIAGELVGRAYDAVTRLAGGTGPLITLDAELFASVVSDEDIKRTGTAGPATPAALNGEQSARLVWAGRMASEKGLTDLIGAVRLLLDSGRKVTLVLIGDGPARPSVARALATLPAERVEDYGYVGNRLFYMDLLRAGDLFVHPSRAEGVPKVLVEAMAAGLPIVASDAGAVRAVLDDGERGRIVPAGDVKALASSIGELLDDDARRRVLRKRGLAWAAEHTAEAQAARLVERLKCDFPHLAWPTGER